MKVFQRVLQIWFAVGIVVILLKAMGVVTAGSWLVVIGVGLFPALFALAASLLALLVVGVASVLERFA